jgi:hypothetical protein
MGCPTIPKVARALEAIRQPHRHSDPELIEGEESRQ